MKVCIIGAGAIGGSIAQRFAAHTGEDVAVLARGAALAAIRRSRGSSRRRRSSLWQAWTTLVRR
jgi:ketopantoate reductase